MLGFKEEDEIEAEAEEERRFDKVRLLGLIFKKS
jgi:hypothetical protein